MSNASDFSDTHYATFHAFLLAAKEKGLNEFRLESSATEQGKLQISIVGDGMLGQFDVRGNVVRPAVPTAKIALPPQSKGGWPQQDGAPGPAALSLFESLFRPTSAD